MSHLFGMLVFAQKKMCDYQRSSGHVVTCQGPVWVRIYQSCTDTGQSSDLSGLVGPQRAKSVSDEFPSEPDMTRQAAMGPDGSLDCPVLMYD